jgi:hypothetical protein
LIRPPRPRPSIVTLVSPVGVWGSARWHLVIRVDFPRCGASNADLDIAGAVPEHEITRVGGGRGCQCCDGEGIDRKFGHPWLVVGGCALIPISPPSFDTL